MAYIKTFLPNGRPTSVFIPDTQEPLQGWDGHSRRGQAAYDRLFEHEQAEADLMDPADRYNMTEEQEAALAERRRPFLSDPD